MLEQDRHTCKVQVQSGNEQGFLYFEDGDLIDAEQGHLRGTEAAYVIISWDNTSIALGETVTRTRQIEHPLGYILLNAAKQHDEQNEQAEIIAKPAITYASNTIESHPEFQTTINVLSNIPGIRYFYILNRAGKIIAHSTPDQTLGELIVYCIITSSNLRKSLNVKSPRRIHMQMKDGSSLLIIPKSGNILGMILEANYSAVEITKQIRADLSVN